MDTTKSIKALLVLDIDGNRTFAKSFDDSLCTKAYERKLFVSTKTNRAKEEILVVDGTLIVHKFITDLHFYVVGDRNENPMILDSILNCFIGVIRSVCGTKGVEKQVFLDKLTKILLALDEICDDGMILENDSNLVMQRVSLKDDIFSEQTMAQKLQSATETFRFPWIRS